MTTQVDPNRADSRKQSPKKTSVATKSVSAETYLEAQDDVDGTGMTYRMHISKRDYLMAHFSEFDYALLHDIDHGKKSSTPMADQLLGLEMIVRRIEEGNARHQVNTAAKKSRKEA